MPTTAIPIGPATTITQNVAYALPSKKVRVTSSLAVQTSMDGSTWTALTGAETTGAETGAVFLRCAVGNAIVTCTAAGELGQSWKAISTSYGSNPALTGAIRLTQGDAIKFKHGSNQIDYNLIGTTAAPGVCEIGQSGVNVYHAGTSINFVTPITLYEVSDPSPVTDKGLLYCKDVAGKTGLFVRFGTGAPIQIAIEP